MEGFFGVDMVRAIVGAFVAIAMNAKLEEDGLTANQTGADLIQKIPKRQVICFNWEYGHKGLENRFRCPISYHIGSICKGGNFNYNF